MQADPAPVPLGIEMAKKAIEYDNGHMYVQAIMCYDMAIDYFNKGLLVEKNDQVKATLTSKVKEYTERSTFLKVSLGMNSIGIGGPQQQPQQQPQQPQQQDKGIFDPFRAPPPPPRTAEAGYILQPSKPSPVFYSPQGGLQQQPQHPQHPQQPFTPMVAPQGYMPQYTMGTPVPTTGGGAFAPMYYYPIQQQQPQHPQQLQQPQQQEHHEKEKEKEKEKGGDEGGEHHHEGGGSSEKEGGGTFSAIRGSKPVVGLVAGTEKIKSSFTKATSSSSSGQSTHVGYMQDNFNIAEDIINKFSCSKNLLAGSMYITENHVCWNTVLPGVDRRVIAKIVDMKSLTKSKLGGISIKMFDKQDYSFSNFSLKGKKEAYTLILRQAKKLNAPVWQTMNYKLNKRLDSVEKKEDKKNFKEQKKEMKRLQKAYKKGEISAEEYHRSRGGKGSDDDEEGLSIKVNQYSCALHTTLSQSKGTIWGGPKAIIFQAKKDGKQLVIPYDEIKSIQKKNQMIKGDVIVVTTLVTEYVFNSFFEREEAVKDLKELWRMRRTQRE